jgi:hypothetical protein
MRLDGYIRDLPIGSKSATVGARIIPVDNQRQAIESYAAKLGGQVCAWHYDAQELVDRGSGGLEDGTRTFFASSWPAMMDAHAAHDGTVAFGSQARVGLQGALKRLGEGETDGIVVMSLDRIAATSDEAHGIFRSIVDAGRVFASCRERLDPQTSKDAYVQIFMEMPPPHPRDVLLFLHRSNDDDDSYPATSRHRYQIPSRSRVRLFGRRLASVFAVPLATFGINRLERPPAPPPVAQRVEVSVSISNDGSSEPPPGSDWKVVSALLQGLERPTASNPGKPKRVVANKSLTEPLRVDPYKIYGTTEPDED